MRNFIAVIGIAMVAALFWSERVWGQESSDSEEPAAAAMSVEPALSFWVPPPDDPKGPRTGMVGQKLTFSTDGTDPLSVHEYMFDWGDGSRLSWKSDDKQSHTYLAEGTYSIRAREKCPLEFFTTDWSGTTEVTISGDIADAWLLSVSSSPVAGIAIGGTSPGTTDYGGLVMKDTQVTLTAPSAVVVKGADYTFQNWVLGGVPQAEGVTQLVFQMDADLDAEAVYLGVERELTVQTVPVSGIEIAGAAGGTTDYFTVVPDNTLVTLTAPSIFDDGESCYGFIGWSGLAGMKASALTQHFYIGSDTTLTATYGMIELAMVYPNQAGTILERGNKVSVRWGALNLPKGIPVEVLLVKGGTQMWTLSAGTTKNPLAWTVGAAIAGEEAYPDGDDYTIIVSALDGAVWAESEHPFAIARMQSLQVTGPTSVQGGTSTPPQYHLHRPLQLRRRPGRDVVGQVELFAHDLCQDGQDRPADHQGGVLDKAVHDHGDLREGEVGSHRQVGDKPDAVRPVRTNLLPAPSVSAVRDGS